MLWFVFNAIVLIVMFLVVYLNICIGNYIQNQILVAFTKVKKQFDPNFGTQCKWIKQFSGHLIILACFGSLMNNFILFVWNTLQLIVICAIH